MIRKISTTNSPLRVAHQTILLLLAAAMVVSITYCGGATFIFSPPSIITHLLSSIHPTFSSLSYVHVFPVYSTVNPAKTPTTLHPTSSSSSNAVVATTAPTTLIANPSSFSSSFYPSYTATGAATTAASSCPFSIESEFVLPLDDFDTIFAEKRLRQSSPSTESTRSMQATTMDLDDQRKKNYYEDMMRGWGLGRQASLNVKLSLSFSSLDPLKQNLKLKLLLHYPQPHQQTRNVAVLGNQWRQWWIIIIIVEGEEVNHQTAHPPPPPPPRNGDETPKLTFCVKKRRCLLFFLSQNFVSFIQIWWVCFGISWWRATTTTTNDQQ